MMKALIVLLAFFLFSCNDGTDEQVDFATGCKVYHWNLLNTDTQSILQQESVGIGSVVYWANLNGDQRQVFLGLGLDSTECYKIVP